MPLFPQVMETKNMLYLVSEYAPNGEIFGKCASSPAPVTLKSKCPLPLPPADPRSRVKVEVAVLGSQYLIVRAGGLCEVKQN